MADCGHRPDASPLDLKIVFAALLLFFSLVTTVYARPTGRFVMVITSPDGGAAANMQTIAQAGGSFVWSGRLPWISVAYSPELTFAERLRGAGAILVLNHRLALGCAKET
ncbi:hypothetical protein [Rhizobium sp. AAP43]|uniref:hypothetical protein n=1 Tax=Rhizobium sp. AAP43 TaxID=1523420 RepID=UPI0006B96361|nr:hypothetical protein [Rhizobium sp. AAP43]KPF41958.1 hypothetical protein IP76_19300 [Rhizobium sp. AAP43]